MKQIIKRFLSSQPSTRPEKPAGNLDNLLHDVDLASAPQLFSVVSWGATATHWLAKLLNSHPEIFCMHNIKVYWARDTNTERIDNAVYMKILLRHGSGYRLVGDCHGVDREAIPNIKKIFRDKFSVAVVTRHPIPRIDSYLKTPKRPGFSSYLDDQTTRERIKKSFSPHLHYLLSDKERLFFAHNVMSGLINIISKETLLGPVFRMEDLTKDLKEVNHLLHFLSGNQIELTPEMVAPIFNTTIVPHRKSGSSSDPADLFYMWPEWKQLLFRELLHPDAKQLYTNLGYNLDFIA